MSPLGSSSGALSDELPGIDFSNFAASARILVLVHPDVVPEPKGENRRVVERLLFVSHSRFTEVSQPKKN